MAQASSTRGNPQILNQKTLLTTQMNSNSNFGLSMQKRSSGAINGSGGGGGSNYNSRQGTHTSLGSNGPGGGDNIPKGALGLSNKVPANMGDNNDYLRLKRVNQNVMGSTVKLNGIETDQLNA